MKVSISNKAAADLSDIINWIAQDDPLTAVRFGDALVSKALDIGETPLAFPYAGRWGGLEVRKRSFKRYLIFYNVGRSGVTITRFVPSSRDYSRLIRTS